MMAIADSSYKDIISGMADAMEGARAFLPSGAAFERFEDLLLGSNRHPKTSLYYSISRRSLVALPFGTADSADRIRAPFNVDLKAEGDVREACREHLRLTGVLVRHEAYPNFAARAKAFAAKWKSRSLGM